MTGTLRFAALVIGPGLLAVVGCAPAGLPTTAAPGKVIPRGRLLQDGLPLRPPVAQLPPGDPGYRVVFIKLRGPGAGTALRASLDPGGAGTFRLIGPEGRGIAPGRYRVAVFLGPEGGADAFQGKYGRENSRIEVDVRAGQDVVIDLENY
jgi:hypothetical protein